MNSTPAFVFAIPTQTIFGAGALHSLHEQALPGKKALIVISNGKSTRANGYLDRTPKGRVATPLAYTTLGLEK